MFSGGNNVLVTFDSTVNIDYGILKVVKDKYSNPKFIDTRILNSINDNFFIRVLLLSNQSSNPIDLIIKDNQKESSDNIYQALLNDEYKNIINSAERTSIYGLLLNYTNAGDGAIRVTILCKNELEQQYIKQLEEPLPCIVEDIRTIDISMYDSIFVKNVDDLFLFKNLEGKSIYVLNYSYNLDPNDNNLVRPDIIKEYGICNVFNIIDTYVDTELPKGY